MPTIKLTYTFAYMHASYGIQSHLHRLLDILEIIAPYKHFHKLRQFVDMKLPPGFPVKLGKDTYACLLDVVSLAAAND